jgi:hypothetical protein
MKGVHIQTHRVIGRIRKYATEMGSSAMLYIRSFIKIGSSTQAVDLQTQSMQVVFAYFRYFEKRK